jgi:hypothetical protein
MPGNANLPIGGFWRAIQENGVPGRGRPLLYRDKRDAGASKPSARQ